MHVLNQIVYDKILIKLQTAVINSHIILEN